MRALGVSVALVLALGVLASASAAVMNFQSLEMKDAQIHDWGYLYQEAGYEVSHPQAEPFQFATFGTQEYRYPGSTALFNDTVDGVITLDKIGGGAFDLLQMDIANLNQAGPVTVNFTGYPTGGGTVNASYTTKSSNNVLETFVFPNTFVKLAKVTWTQGAPFHQFDNINVIPEPASILLLGVVALLRRR